MKTKLPLSCLKCPNHKVISDPDPNDWFCDDDVAVVCTVSPNKERNCVSKWRTDRQEFAIIGASIRPYNIKKEITNIPTWCPLRKK